jgi:hypothetical protein
MSRIGRRTSDPLHLSTLLASEKRSRRQPGHRESQAGRSIHSLPSPSTFVKPECVRFASRLAVVSGRKAENHAGPPPEAGEYLASCQPSSCRPPERPSHSRFLPLNNSKGDASTRRTTHMLYHADFHIEYPASMSQKSYSLSGLAKPTQRWAQRKRAWSLTSGSVWAVGVQWLLSMWTVRTRRSNIVRFADYEGTWPTCAGRCDSTAQV